MTKNEQELLAGAVKAMQTAIHPLIHEQPFWDGYRPLWADSLYTRLTDAKTAASVATGAPMQASKPPGRIDVMAWFHDIDSTVAEYPGPPRPTVHKLEHYYQHTWNPTQLQFIKTVTQACQRWTETAEKLLGDTPPQVPLRRRCPICQQKWHIDRDGNQQWALKVTASMTDWWANCLACKTTWTTPAEQAIFRQLLGDTPQ